MRIGRLEITGSRWPWYPISGRWDQPDGRKYGWKKVGGMGRFGGGWEYCLGIDIGGTTVILKLIFGMLRITWKEKA
jgi:hypothetical protein